MKAFGRIAYWILALALVALILVSLDYSLVQGILMGLVFGPCALALEFLMPKTRKPMDKVYLSLAVLVAVILLIMIIHFFVWNPLSADGGHREMKDIPPMLINPAFLGLILMSLAIGDYFWAKWLAARFRTEDRSITFFSDRKSVTLRLAEIAYIESNDTEVRIVTADGGSYRNKTGIAQWENLLGEGFLRIHRSYLVNVASASLSSADTVTVGNDKLPVSRKYKESVISVLDRGSGV